MNINLHNILRHFFTANPHRSLHGQDLANSPQLQQLANALNVAVAPSAIQELAQWAADNSNSEVVCMLTITDFVRLHIWEQLTEEEATLFHADVQAAYFNRETLHDWLSQASQQIDNFYLEYEDEDATHPEPSIDVMGHDVDDHTGSLHIEQRGQSHINITINFR